MTKKENQDQPGLFSETTKKTKAKREGTRQQRILEDFAATWEKHTGSQYLINWGKDVKFVNALIEMSITPDEYQARKAAFFADRKWWEFGKWDFAVFVKHINKCVPQTSSKRAPTEARPMMIRCAEHSVEHDAYQQCPKCREENEEIMKKASEN